LTQNDARTFTALLPEAAIKAPQQSGTPEGDAMGMLRNIIIVGAAIAFMPSPPPGENDAPSQAVSSFAYLAAAAETVADFRSFCQRNPNVCVTAEAMAKSMEGKAKYSAKLVYEWANDINNTERQVSLPADVALQDPIQTGSPARKGVLLKESQNTLTVADLVVPWRKPKDLSPKG
jgi:Family of unknown function (DUF5330)